MASEKVREIQELRRSSAASPVNRELTRKTANDDAIAEQLDDWYEDDDFGHSLWDNEAWITAMEIIDARGG